MNNETKHKTNKTENCHYMQLKTGKTDIFCKYTGTSKSAKEESLFFVLGTYHLTVPSTIVWTQPIRRRSLLITLVDTSM